MSDLIDRQDAIDALMKRDKELRNINWYDKPFAEGECKGIDYALEIVSALPSAEPEPMTISIDHELTQEEYKKLRKDMADTPIVLIPSAHERKTGRWIEMGKNEDGTHNLCCGVCGKFKFKSKGHANSQYTKERYKFCGGCGAKMR